MDKTKNRVMDSVDRAQRALRLHRSVEELGNLQHVLESDVSKCREILLSKEGLADQFWRRVYCRSVFTHVEGLTYQMKQVAFFAHEIIGHTFSPGEIALLLEESYYIDDKGKVRKRDSYTKPTANIRFAFDAMARSFQCDFTLNVGGDGWHYFRNAIEVRNRLTHPKFAQELFVSKEEISTFANAQSWFNRHFTSLMRAVTDSIVEKNVPLLRKEAQNDLNIIVSEAIEYFKTFEEE